MNAAPRRAFPVSRSGRFRWWRSQPIYVELRVGTKAQNEMFVNGAKSGKGYERIVQQTKKSSSFEDRSTNFY